jgi:antitoxin component HigA of HigAB toxin-antitoxin module
MTPRYYLQKGRIVAAIDASHLCQAGFAAEIGLSRSHWSQVLNRHRAATPRVRRALLHHAVLQGIPESELWDVVADYAEAA